MFPLIFFRIGRYFVFFWGLLFFTNSLLLFNLSYLAYIEFVFWILVFVPISSNKERVEIFYDNYCNLCKKAMRFLKWINFNGAFVFSPLSTNKERIESFGFSDKEIKSYMTGQYKGKSFIGYDLYRVICRVNPLLWVLVPVVFLGKITRLGYVIYNYIAENRYKYFDQCEISFEDEIARKEPVLRLPTSAFLSGFLYVFYLGIIGVYICFRLPIVSYVIPKPYSLMRPAQQLLSLTGFDLPDVFNKTDLSMGDKWLEIYRVEGKNTRLVPMSGPDGQRLTYSGFNVLNFSNQNSDLLYIGTTLKFRRAIIGKDIDTLIKKEFSYWWFNVDRAIGYDYRFNRFTGKKVYEVKIYGNSSSEVTHAPSNPDRYKKKLKFHSSYMYDGQHLHPFPAQD